jgi:transposase
MIEDAKPTQLKLTGDVFDSLPESVRFYICFLESRIEKLETIVQQQEAKIKELEARLSKNSSNSSKPPGSDGLKKQPKTNSQRGKSGKKPGGQLGRNGKTLEQVENPDQVIVHSPIECQGCGSSLLYIESISTEKRQIFDVPKPDVKVTEHRVEAKKCPCCGETSKGLFPVNVRAPVQYGERVQALVAYLQHQHLLPVERVCQIFEDLFNVMISPGTCSKIDQKLFKNLDSFETDLKAYLLASRVLHFDETGMRCNKSLHWIHVTSSESATFYGMHTKRGQEAINYFDLLPKFQGNAIHDHWFPYFAYTQVIHGLCNAHHLRELTFIYEQEKEEWAGEMRSLLLKGKKLVEDHADKNCLPEEIKAEVEKEYAAIVLKGLIYHLNLSPLPINGRGKRKQRAGKNLLDRFADKRDCVLRFIHDFTVPFTNNLGEQDIRMMKVKQKISGCFRTVEGGTIFCRIRSYISTARKQGWQIWDALADAIRGIPRLLSLQFI